MLCAHRIYVLYYFHCYAFITPLQRIKKNPWWILHTETRAKWMLCHPTMSSFVRDSREWQDMYLVQHSRLPLSQQTLSSHSLCSHPDAKCLTGDAPGTCRSQCRGQAAIHTSWHVCVPWWWPFSPWHGRHSSFIWSSPNSLERITWMCSRFCSRWPMRTRASTRSSTASCGNRWGLL